MSKITRDSLMASEVDPGDEPVLAEWRGDAMIYWKNHLILAAVLGVGAGGVLWFMGNPHLWTGPLAGILAVMARAAYLRSEAMSDRWRLTKTRLIGPRGLVLTRSSIANARVMLGEVLVTTLSGDKHLIRYMADPAAVAARLQTKG